MARDELHWIFTASNEYKKILLKDFDMICSGNKEYKQSFGTVKKI